MKYLKHTAGFLLSVIICYLIGSFGFWEIDPSKWTQSQRAGLFPLAFFVSALFFIIDKIEKP